MGCLISQKKLEVDIVIDRLFSKSNQILLTKSPAMKYIKIQKVDKVGHSIQYDNGYIIITYLPQYLPNKKHNNDVLCVLSFHKTNIQNNVYISSSGQTLDGEVYNIGSNVERNKLKTRVLSLFN